eukprot:9145262-Pyramimonas_sp.AAC.2
MNLWFRVYTPERRIGNMVAPNLAMVGARTALEEKLTARLRYQEGSSTGGNIQQRTIVCTYHDLVTVLQLLLLLVVLSVPAARIKAKPFSKSYYGCDNPVRKASKIRKTALPGRNAFQVDLDKRNIFSLPIKVNDDLMRCG